MRHVSDDMKAAVDAKVTEKSEKKVWRWAAVIILVLTFLAVGAHGIHLVDPKSVETALDQNPGPQSNATDVRHFIETHHILYTGYSADPPRMFGKIYGSSIGLMKGHILVVFDFNKDGRLVSHRVVELFQFF